MKRLVAIVLVSLFAFTFGCGPKAPAAPATTPEAAPAASTDAAPAPEAPAAPIQ